MIFIRPGASNLYGRHITAYGANGEQERVAETEKALEVRLSIN